MLGQLSWDWTSRTDNSEDRLKQLQSSLLQQLKGRLWVHLKAQPEPPKTEEASSLEMTGKGIWSSLPKTTESEPLWVRITFFFFNVCSHLVFSWNPDMRASPSIGCDGYEGEWIWRLLPEKRTPHGHFWDGLGETIPHPGMFKIQLVVLKHGELDNRWYGYCPRLL